MNMPDIRKSQVAVRLDNRLIVAIEQYAKSIGIRKTDAIIACLIDRFGGHVKALPPAGRAKADEMDRRNRDKRHKTQIRNRQKGANTCNDSQ